MRSMEKNTEAAGAYAVKETRGGKEKFMEIQEKVQTQHHLIQDMQQRLDVFLVRDEKPRDVS